MVRQNIIFVENRAGSLEKVTKILVEKDINIYGFACFDSPEFAVFRMVCSDPEEADRVLREKGYMCRINPVIMVHLPDEPGGLDSLLEILRKSNVSLNYIYTSYLRRRQLPVVILHSEDILVTESILEKNGFEILEDTEELFA